MSQIASFYLLKNNQRQELSNGDCSGAVYMAIWDWCESELNLDVRFPAPQTEDTLDCALLEGELASKLLAALREQNLPELVREHLGGLRPVVCANLPYNVTTPLLTAFIEAGCFASITGMIQREVARSRSCCSTCRRAVSSRSRR